MKLTRSALAMGAVWTAGAYAASQALRFLTNVVLARLLAPELFGAMLIVNTVRTGTELLSDIGVTQSMVQSKQAEDPEFYNTAWTMQALRGALLLVVCAGLGAPVAHFYGRPELTSLIAVAAIGFLISGLTSMSPALLQRRMELKALNAFELLNVAAFTLFQIITAYLWPSIWSLILGLLFGMTFRTIASHVLPTGISHRPAFRPEHAWRIFRFGRWIGLSSVIFFFSTSFDRLYLARSVPLATLGIYGLARTITEVVSSGATSLANYIVFPLVSTHHEASREKLRRQIADKRLLLLILSAGSIAVLAAVVDLLVTLVFDARYHDASWMARILFAGAWLSVLCSVNEAALLGLGKPAYGAAANASKLAWLVIGLPLGFTHFGLVGGLIAIASAEIGRYIPVLIGLMRAEFSFLRQDIAASIFLMITFACCVVLRGWLGFAPPF
jgi:O-antigen/teichoic acid export membrane protein